MSEKDPKRSGPRPIGDLVPASLQRSRTPVLDRLLGDPFLVDADNDNTILYQHSVSDQPTIPRSRRRGPFLEPQERSGTTGDPGRQSV
jgi:hypothetical protein